MPPNLHTKSLAGLSTVHVRGEQEGRISAAAYCREDKARLAELISSRTKTNMWRKITEYTTTEIYYSQCPVKIISIWREQEYETHSQEKNNQ